MEKKQEMLQIGIITNSHGIHGEVKVLPTTDNPERFCELKEIILDKDGLNLTLEITGVKFFKQYVILKFKEFDHIEEIEKYKGKDLFVTRENAVSLEEDEYFIADLLGLTVQADDGRILGKIKEVIQTGANDVYVVEEKGKFYYLPVIKQCVLNVSLEQQLVTVHLMKGLEEL